MNDELDLDNAIRQAPTPQAAAAIRAAARGDAAKTNIGARLSPSEREALAAFKAGARAAESVRQQNEKHGGPARIAQKERATAGVLAQNIHNKGK